MKSSKSSRDPVVGNPGVLASWAAIAKYFDCNERTAKRWEHERGLPVHRAPGGARGYVFAYTRELEAWLRFSTEKGIAEPVPGHSGAGSLDGSNLSPALKAPSEIGLSPGQDSSPPSSENRFLSRRWFLAAAAGAILLLGVAAPWIYAILRNGFPDSSRSLVWPMARKHVPPPGAEASYLRGRYFANLRTKNSLATAIDAYTQAVVQDPSYAEAYAGLAESYDLLPQFGQAALGSSLTKANDAARRALQLNPNLASAHAAKAIALFFWDWDIAGSDSEFKRALALDPNSARTHQWYASTLECRDDGAETLRQIREALRLDPASPSIAADAAYFQADFSDYNAGVNALKEIEQTQPTLASPAYFLRELYFGKGDYPGYVAEARSYASITHSPDDAALANAVALGWARSGRTGLLEERARVLKAAFDRGSEPGFALGQTLVLLGRRREALPYFQASFDRRFILLITMEDCRWAKPLLTDPGYAALFAQIRERLRGSQPAHPQTVRVSIGLPQ